MGCYEVSLGDTIGTGTPGKTKAMIEACAMVLIGRSSPARCRTT
jgi:hydroxymethylglutaryl-CoA lyase